MVTYAVLVFVLIISTRGLQIAKIEISLCAAVTLFMGVYVVKQLRVKECLHTHDESAPEEQLGRTRYYKSAIRLIRKNAALTHPRRQSAYALLSPWGNGKTHFIQHIKADLNADVKQKEEDKYNGKFRICEVSLWESKTPDEAWVNIINALYSSVTNSSEAQRIPGLPGTFLTLILKIGGIFSSDLSNLHAIIKIVTEDGTYGIEDKVSVIDEKLGTERALLILEDVDRASYKIIKGLLPLIERLKKISKLSIICSMDVEEVAKLYQSRHNIDEDTLRGYLFKVFEYTFLLPDMSEEMMHEKMCAAAKKKYPECRLLNMFVNEVELKYDTPRQMERMLDEWANIERNFFLIPDTFEIDQYTKKDAFRNFTAKALSICAPRKTRELLGSKDLLANIKGLIEESRKLHGETSAMTEVCNNSNSRLEDSCFNFFKENNTHLITFKDAVEQQYARRIDIKDWECADLVDKYWNLDINGIFELLDVYFKEAPLEKQSRKSAACDLYFYAVKRFANTEIEEDRNKYFEFLVSLTDKLPNSSLTYREDRHSPFTIHFGVFDVIIGVLLLNFKKYISLIDLIFDKLSYYNQAVVCLRMNLVYADEESEAYYSRESVPPLLKRVYRERETDEYKSIIARYVSKYVARYCEYMMQPVLDDDAIVSSYVLYLYMEPKFAPSSDLFDYSISDWLCMYSVKKCAFLCGYIQHLLTKVCESNVDFPKIYIPQGITEKLPSVFALMSNVGDFTPEGQREIESTINHVLPQLRSLDHTSSDAAGIPEVIERMQACLEQIETIRQAKGEVVEG